MFHQGSFFYVLAEANEFLLFKKRAPFVKAQDYTVPIDM